ncbi:MOSC domain-containing protein [bacterium]|nr:MAG: MOSC domain-containing protein [bacterium]
MTLKSLSIYPIKSCGAIDLLESEVEARGLKFDRRWMIVDESGRFITQRENPSLATIRPKITRNELILSCGNAQIDIPLHHEGGKFMSVQVWRDQVKAMRVGDLADDWLRDVLGIDAHLVWMPDESLRLVDTDYAHQNEITSFADGFPFLVLSQASVDDLNDRILPTGREPVEANRFRSNFLIEGATAYDEDSWAHFRIGDCEFEIVKPCSRCPMPTIDQTTGERKGPEPLRTLATYRKHDGKVYLAQNALPRKMGKVRVGDKIEVLSRQS